jgi:hypothetical protein
MAEAIRQPETRCAHGFGHVRVKPGLESGGASAIR